MVGGMRGLLQNTLTEYDEDKKEKGYGYFRKGAEIAKSLGTNIISICTLSPKGLNDLNRMPTLYAYNGVNLMCLGLSSEEKVMTHPKLSLNYPEGFSWQKDWDNFVESMKKLTEIAEEFDLKFAVEQHPSPSFISTTDSLLRLFEEVSSPTIGANLDTGW
ncbi:unnamed protein product, partial [marine sediment metagenome]